ncbi:MAG: XrtA/PEP-CTERM system TPR-repeat protein PrsT [Actinomycetota bacterium]
MIPGPWMRPAALSALLTALVLSGCKDDPPELLVASAREHLARHDNRTAIIQAKNALQQKPDLAEARYLLARALLETGDAAGAELEARKAMDLHYAPEKALPLMAKALVAEGKIDKAIDTLAAAKPAGADGRAEVQTVLATAYGSQGDMQAAEKALARAFEAHPDYGPAMLVQARLKAATRDHAAALARLESLLAKEPDNDEAWKLKGDILAVQGQGDAALAAYRKALETRPDVVANHVALTSALLDLARVDEAAAQLEALGRLAPKAPETRYLEVLLALRKGRYDAAHDLVQNLLQMAPDNPKVLQLAGTVEYQRRAWQLAQTHLSRALDFAPDLPLARRLLVAAYLQGGQAGKAMAALQPAMGQVDGDAQLLALAGQVYLQNGDIRKAEQYFAKAAALDPKDAGKRTSLALAHLAKGQDDQALGELEHIAATDVGTVADLALISSLLQRNELPKALQAISVLEKKQPGQPLAHDLRGRTLAAMGDAAGARKSFEQALAANPSYFPAIAGLARLDMAAGQPEEAKKRFERILSSDPRNSQALLALADLKRQAGAKPQEVAALLNRAVVAVPNEPAPRLFLIDHYLRNNDVPHAVAAAQEAVSAMPDRPDLLNALGRAQQAGKDYQQALATYGKWAALDRSSPEPYLRMADIHLANGNREAAVGSLKKSLELAPIAPVAIRLHGVLQGQGEAEAERFAAAWLKDHPKDASFLYYLGDQALVKKDYDTASRHYKAALEIQPDNAAVLNNLAWVAGRQKSPLAVQYAERANRLAPNQPAMMDTLAMLLIDKGESKRALELLRRAVELAPNAPQIRLNLAKALIRAGDKTAARKELEQLERQGGKFDGQAEIAQLLSQV